VLVFVKKFRCDALSCRLTNINEEGYLLWGQIKPKKGQSPEKLCHLLETIYIENVRVAELVNNSIVRNLYDKWLEQLGSDKINRYIHMQYHPIEKNITFQLHNCPEEIYHVTVRPCYDKILETTSDDFVIQLESHDERSGNEDNMVTEVDSVLTTGDVLELIQISILHESSHFCEFIHFYQM
ncbi:hypothetical protein S83_054659, partial [Arachis hypogaea]